MTYAGGTPGFSRNTDGFHCVGPIDDLSLENLHVSCNDDSFALNATDGQFNSSGSVGNPTGGSFTAGTSPQCLGGFPACYAGPITRVFAKNIVGSNTLNFIRLLPGAFLIDDVTISGVSGTSYGGSLTVIPFSGSGSGGSIGTIRVLDWRAKQNGIVSFSGQSQLGVATKSFEWDVINSANSGYVPSLVVSASVSQLKASVRSNEYGAMTQASTVDITGTGSVGVLDVSGIRTRTGQGTTTTPFVLIRAGGTANHVKLHDITDDNGGGLLSNAGTVQDLSVNGCSAYSMTGTGLATTTTIPKLTGRGNIGVTTTGTFTAATTFESAS